MTCAACEQRQATLLELAQNNARWLALGLLALFTLAAWPTTKETP